MNFAGIIKTEETAIAKEDISFGDRILFVLEQQRRSKAWLAEQIGISKQAINYLVAPEKLAWPLKNRSKLNFSC